MTKKPLIIISGPTAAGKTALSIKLSEIIGGSIISADSMQVYKGFNIGTAKISREEMQGIPHYLIDELEADEEFNVFEFKTRACRYIEEIYAQGRIPLIVGGTGFYIQSVLYDIDFSASETDNTYRSELEGLALSEGADYLHQMLSDIDPQAAEQIHPNNIKRVIRALEYHRETGARISEHNEQQRQKESAYNFVYFVLNRDRAVVYERINKRVDMMISQGLTEEVRFLLESGISPDSLAMQGLGYKEIIPYLQGKTTLDEAVHMIKQNTRHFAKRQLTWFRREKDVIWMNYEDYDSESQMLDSMVRILKEKKIV